VTSDLRITIAVYAAILTAAVVLAIALGSLAGPLLIGG
jgi:hypothetical protein